MKPKINLCIFNHPASGVQDQIWFAKEVFTQHGYEFICTTTLSPHCLNLLIENFIEDDVDLLESFSQRFGKQVGLVMTEHIERGAEDFTVGGAPLEDRVYIENKEQRLYSLLAITDFVFAYFTFGELPELNTWNEICLSHRLYRLPYPLIQKAARRATPPDYDIVFTGTTTPHREAVLRQLGGNYRLIRAEIMETEEERAKLYARAKVAVTIPQTGTWKWVSLMRVMFGLRTGVPTVDLGRDRTTNFGRMVLPTVEIGEAVANYERLFQQQLKAYESFVRSRDNGPFPSGVFDLWAELEADRQGGSLADIGPETALGRQCAADDRTTPAANQTLSASAAIPGRPSG